MTERESLIRQVVANPDDDMPRLVFADWLEENGESERAEFIHSEIEINRIETQVWCSLEWTDEEWGDRERREKQITDECNNSLCPKCGPLYNLRYRRNVLLWRQDMPPEKEAFPRRDWFPFDEQLSHAHGGWSYRRGFVESIRCPYQNWQANWKVLLESAPIRKVKLTSQPQFGVGGITPRHGDPMPLELEGVIVQIPHRPYPEYAPGRTRDWYKTVLELRWPGIEFETAWHSVGTLIDLPNELLQHSIAASEALLRDDVTRELACNLMLYGNPEAPQPLGLIRAGHPPLTEASFIQLPAANPPEVIRSLTAKGMMTSGICKPSNRKARRSKC